MTALEAQEMFDAEVEPWIKRGDRPVADTIMGRWVSNLMLATKDDARKILHDLQEAPGKKVDVRAFRAAVPRRPQPGARVMGPDYHAWVVCLDPPEAKPGWKGQRWAVFTPSCDRGSQEKVGMWASEAAREIQGREGGRWSGQVERVPDEIPENAITGKRAAAEARQRILSGPDSPGRRFLESLKGGMEAPGLVRAVAKALPTLPKLPPPRTIGAVVAGMRGDRLAEDLPPVNLDEAEEEMARQARGGPIFDPPGPLDNDLPF